MAASVLPAKRYTSAELLTRTLGAHSLARQLNQVGVATALLWVNSNPLQVRASSRLQGAAAGISVAGPKCMGDSGAP
jgi:hypothetical protein